MTVELSDNVNGTFQAAAEEVEEDVSEVEYYIPQEQNEMVRRQIERGFHRTDEQTRKRNEFVKKIYSI